MRKYDFTISVRLCREDKQRYERLLQRFADAFSTSQSERFRSLLKRLDIPYETKWDNPGFDDLPEVSETEDPEADSEEESEFRPDSFGLE